MSIVTQHPSSLCNCGAVARPVTLVAPDGDEINIMVCDDCRARTDERLDQVRPVAETMRGCSIPEDIVNEVMAVLLDRLDEDNVPSR